MLLLFEDLRTTSQGYDQPGVPEGRTNQKKKKQKKKKKKKRKSKRKKKKKKKRKKKKTKTKEQENEKKKLKKKQKKKKKKELESRESLRKGRNYVSCYFFPSISGPKSSENRSKCVSRWALVASWGHLPRHEGAWGAVWGCWRLLGGQGEG